MQSQAVTYQQVPCRVNGRTIYSATSNGLSITFLKEDGKGLYVNLTQYCRAVREDFEEFLELSSKASITGDFCFDVTPAPAKGTYIKYHVFLEVITRLSPSDPSDKSKLSWIISDLALNSPFHISLSNKGVKAQGIDELKAELKSQSIKIDQLVTTLNTLLVSQIALKGNTP